jgi:hypothetical protein
LGSLTVDRNWLFVFLNNLFEVVAEHVLRLLIWVELDFSRWVEVVDLAFGFLGFLFLETSFFSLDGGDHSSNARVRVTFIFGVLLLAIRSILVKESWVKLGHESHSNVSRKLVDRDLLDVGSKLSQLVVGLGDDGAELLLLVDLVLR